MQTLLIWDQGDWGTSLYLIPDAPDWVTDVEGVFLNATESTDEQDKLICRISDAVCENPEHYYGSDCDIAGAWVKYKLGPGTTIEGSCRIVMCGWIG